MQSAQFRDFWDKMANPAHAHSSDRWYDRYAEEILFFLAGARSIIDAGCGSGEILLRIAPHFEKVYALDYARSMLDQARENLSKGGISHVVFFCDTITNMDIHCTEPVDAIYCNGVIQYLSPAELEKFLSACHRLLNQKGKVILLNIPNINNRILFLLGFYKHEKQVYFFRILRGLLTLWLKMVWFALRNQFRKFDDGIGNWFSIEQIKVIGTDQGFSPEIFGASIVNYNYRFHAVLTKEDKYD